LGQALQGKRQLVFVSQGNGHFEPRDVRVADRGDGQALIIDGLHEHDAVVTRAAFLIDSESQMRAALENYGVASAASAGNDVTISVRSNPDVSRAATNTVEVQVRDRIGRPVTDADIELLFSMPAMPTMSMPAMRSTAHLIHVEEGLYRGAVALPMTGAWDVSVKALRDNRVLARVDTTLTAR